MATAKWSAAGTRGSNIASTTLNSLANGSASSFITHDNSTAKDLYFLVTLKLGSLNPTTGASVTLAVFASDGTDVPDNTASVGGGERYTETVTTGSGAKVVNFRVRAPGPFSLRFSFVNNTNVSLASSSNEVYVTTFNEEVA